MWKEDTLKFLKQFYNESSNLYEFTEEEIDNILDQFIETTNKSISKFTEKGIKIIKCMQENQEKYMNIFSSKTIGELLFMAPRSVSGSMKKLITDGYVIKVGANPVSYSLTDAGNALQLDND